MTQKVLIANIPTQISTGNGFERYFVKAGSRWPFSGVKKREDKMAYMPFPFYLAYTSSVLREAGVNTYFLDGVALNLSEAEFEKAFLKISPTAILIESQTPTIDRDLDVLRRLKKLNPSLKVLLAGPHPTIFARDILKENSFVDIILLREYEFSCLNVLKSLNDNKNLNLIKGIVFRDGKKIIYNEAELLDVNLLPFPDRDHLPLEKRPDLGVYWDGFCQLKPCIQMHASRGCPFRCNFCLWNQVMYCNKPYRPFEPKKVVDEMEYCKKKYGAKEIYFDDDTFTGNKRHVLEICKEIKKRKLKLKWSCMGDAMITDPEMIQAMYSAGCIGIKFGVESGNKEILNRIEKPINFEKIRVFLKECSKRKIKTHGTFTFGIMGETKETMNQTLDLAKDLDVDSVQFSITTPFPGTRYFEEMDKQGKILSKNWSDYDGSSNSLVDFGSLTNEEVVSFCNVAKNRWFRHKVKDLRWLYRQIFFQIRSSINQGPKYFFIKVQRFFSLIN